MTGTAINTYKSAQGETALPVDPSRWAAINALATSAGQVTSYPGVYPADGTIDLADVPAGPFLLEIVGFPPAAAPTAPAARSYYEVAGSTFALGLLLSCRPNLETISQPSFLQINAALTHPWQTYAEGEQGEVLNFLEDELHWFSRNADVTGFAAAGYLDGPESQFAPQFGDTTLGWSLDARSLTRGFSDNVPHRVRGELGDDLTLLHNVAAEVFNENPTPGGPNPWNYYSFTSNRGAFRPAPFSLVDGGTVAVSGAFVETPQKTFSLVYRGELCNEILRHDGPGLAGLDAFLSFSIVMEPGTPAPYVGATAPLFGLNVFAPAAFPDPICNPEFCVPELCAEGCGSVGETILPGDHDDDFPYGNPFSYGQEFASFLYDFGTDVTGLVPGDNGTFERLRGTFEVDVPFDDVNGHPLAPAVGLPRDVRVDLRAVPTAYERHDVYGYRDALSELAGSMVTSMNDLAARVLALVEAIPAGRVLSYGDVAAGTGAPTPREVGEVLQQSHDVPWWRVLRVDGTCAPHLRARQIALLAAEGAPFMADGGTVDMAHARWVEGLPPEPTGKQLSLFGSV